MRFVTIAPVGDQIENVFKGIKEFSPEKIILVAPVEYVDVAKSAKKQISGTGMPCQIITFDGDVWEGMFRAIAQIKDIEKGKELIVNTSTGDKTTTCAATSAAFVNGIKAFSVEGDEPMLLPVLKFSYYNILSENKLRILKVLEKNKGGSESFEEISKKTKMSFPLLSYHINGNLKSEGLCELGLVETGHEEGRVIIRMTLLGRMLMKGYIG